MKIIVMADVIGSSKRNGKTLMNALKAGVTYVNKKDKQFILSPMTITLGDEFQGVVKNPHAALQIILDMEMYLISLKSSFTECVNQDEVNCLTKDEVCFILGQIHLQCESCECGC